MTRIYALLLPALFICSSSIYDLQVTGINGETISLNDFRGKKILFVNTATNSPHAGQYAALEQLYQQHKDSLVVIAFPSNSFGNEPAGDSTINALVTQQYNIHYLLAAKTSVKDSSISPLYKWLTQKAENGMMDNPVDSDFFKFFVDGDGYLRGAFDASVDPAGSMIQSVIEN